jgi:exosortase
VIFIPGQQLFVAEACSGLRSLTALVALGVMVGGMWLTTAPARILLLLIAIPVAVLVNGIRVFLTAFLMHYVDPALGRGFMHESQGWGLFLVSLLILASITFLVRQVEVRVTGRGADHA